MNKKKLFIGNLNYTVNEGQLRMLLSPYGDVIGINVIEGKGYAFVEMGTEEQALNIQRTLSESVFEGRKLLIDGVPGKNKPIRRENNALSQPRRTRPSVSARDSEPGVHHVEAFERPPKPERKTRDPVDNARRSGKPSQPGRAPDRQSKPAQGQQASAQTPKTDKYPQSRPDAQRPASESGNRVRPAHPADGQRPSPQKSKMGGKPQEPGRESDRKTHDSKPKKIKEKPPKNPHPYQGSKKPGKSIKPKGESEDKTDDSPDTEKKDFLRYWATLAGKRDQ